MKHGYSETKSRPHRRTSPTAIQATYPLPPDQVPKQLAGALLLFLLLPDELLGSRLGLVKAPGLDLALKELVELGRRATGRRVSLDIM